MSRTGHCAHPGRRAGWDPTEDPADDRRPTVAYLLLAVLWLVLPLPVLVLVGRAMALGLAAWTPPAPTLRQSTSEA